MLPSPYQYICKLEIISQIINKCNQRNNILHTYAQKGLKASYRITHTVISNWIMYIDSIFHSIIRNPRKLPIYLHYLIHLRAKNFLSRETKENLINQSS